MIISKKELLDLFQSMYETEQEAKQLKKEVNEQLSNFAESNGVSPKALREAFSMFKAFRAGKVSSHDEDYFSLMNIIEEYFAKGNTTITEEDSVSM
ncbi:MAG TPA: hypothetical protein P5140_07675 [Methanofastidiosum sp.]|nr:hypothetical protein [Methanofastidiosum sp.]